MKALLTLALGLFLTVNSFATDRISDSDLKWKLVVAEMIAEGPTTISTPLERRVEIVKQLAEDAGRTVTVQRAEKSFRIKVK